MLYYVVLWLGLQTMCERNNFETICEPGSRRTVLKTWNNARMTRIHNLPQITHSCHFTNETKWLSHHREKIRLLNSLNLKKITLWCDVVSSFGEKKQRYLNLKAFHGKWQILDKWDAWTSLILILIDWRFV